MPERETAVRFDTLDLLRSPKLTAVVADTLRRKIVSGELQEGDKLPPEPELMVQLGVSRPTLREALRVLESESLIRPRRGSRTGAEVCAPSVAVSARYTGFVLQHQGVSIEDLLEARSVLEPPLAAMAVNKLNPEKLAVLREAIAEEEAALDDPVAFGEASIRFHELVAGLADVKTLLLTLRQLNWVIGTLTTAAEAESVTGGKGNSRAHRAHVRFVELIEAGSPPEAIEDYWQAHVEEIDRQLLKGRKSERIIDLFR